MKNKAWAKTILEIYRHLETICGAIDDIVKRTSMSGFGKSNDTKYSADKIIELTCKKKKLINLKVLTEKVLSELSTFDIKILTLFYIDSVTAKNLSEMFNINIRTFFRKKDLALNSFVSRLKAEGFDYNKLCDIYSTEHWIINTYQNNLNVMLSRKDADQTYTFILNHAINELKNFEKKKYVYN